jgi:Cu2+-exporting ATPase
LTNAGARSEGITCSVAGSAGTTRLSCFHCGLPVTSQNNPGEISILGSLRSFCCHGCRAVCKAIVDAGCEDYYRYRSADAVSANVSAVPEFLKQAELYDRPEIQHDLVSAGDGWRQTYLLLENIRCPACLWLNERRLRSLDGIIDVHIDDVTQRARVRWNPDKIRLSEILGAISRIGYLAHPYDARRSAQLERVRKRRSTEKLIFAGITGMFVMNFSIATYTLGQGEVLPLWETVGRWTCLFISFLILAYSGQDFFAGAWNDIRNRRAGMDIPVVLGLSIAWLGSLHATVTGQGEVYFDSIAMFVFLLLLARRLELRGRVLAASRLDRLNRATPRRARLLDEDGAYSEVAARDLQPGDNIRLVPGETVPVDAVLTSGTSSFDESLLTGEAQPVLKKTGDKLIAGSTNGDQVVHARVTRRIEASALHEIQTMVERGLQQRPRHALLAERLAGWFVAGLIAIAAATASYWYLNGSAQWLSNTIAVLIVTCPCALALATPVTLAVSAGRFMDMGVLPLRMRALDALAKADLFAFDKTGTLTTGRLSLASVTPVGALGRRQCLGIAAALSANSEHPVARALNNAAATPRGIATPLENLPGRGIRALLGGKEWRMGKPEFVTEAAAAEPELLAKLERCRARGQTVSLLANDEGIQAILCFEDSVRPGIPAMLAELKASGVQSFAVLSGDNESSVALLGRQIGIQDCHYGMSPLDKLSWINGMQRAGRRVVMLGDGVNDAPTLAAADASASFAGATDLASSSSDFLLTARRADCLSSARRLAQRTRYTIMQNIGWALTYNLFAVPFAAVGLIPPWGAAIGMSMSSLLVVLNALRLNAGRVDGRTTA